MPHPNEEMLRQAYATFAQGDLQGYLKYCTDDITFHVPGRNQVAGDYTREHFASSLISKVMGLTNGSFREAVNDVVANDTRGVVLATHEFERQGKSFSYKTTHVYRIREGKLAEFAEYPEDQYLFDEA
jgi:ketosteroid isomerase-like protein